MIKSLIIGQKIHDASQNQIVVLKDVEVLISDQKDLKEWSETIERIPIQITGTGFVEVKSFEHNKALINIHIG